MLQTDAIAPDFTALTHTGESFTLNAIKGKKVILFFYPKDDTPGCTAQACSLRDNYGALQKAGFEVIGISKDTEQKHLKYRTKYELPYKLIADTDTLINQKYEVWAEKKFMGKTYMGTSRTTFILDELHIIKQIITEVNTAKHGEQILDLIQSNNL